MELNLNSLCKDNKKLKCFLSKIIAISISEADPAMAFCFRAAPSKLASHKKKVILCFQKISATLSNR